MIYATFSTLNRYNRTIFDVLWMGYFKGNLFSLVRLQQDGNEEDDCIEAATGVEYGSVGITRYTSPARAEL